MFADQKTEAIFSSPTCSNIVNWRTDFLPYFEAYLEFFRILKCLRIPRFLAGTPLGLPVYFDVEHVS